MAASAKLNMVFPFGQKKIFALILASTSGKQISGESYKNNQMALKLGPRRYGLWFPRVGPCRGDRRAPAMPLSLKESVGPSNHPGGPAPMPPAATGPWEVFWGRIVGGESWEVS